MVDICGRPFVGTSNDVNQDAYCLLSAEAPLLAADDCVTEDLEDRATVVICPKGDEPTCGVAGGA